MTLTLSNANAPCETIFFTLKKGKKMHYKIVLLGVLGAASACNAATTTPSAVDRAVLVASPAPPAGNVISQGLQIRADQLVGLFSGTNAPADFFQPGFQDKFSAEKVERVQTMVRDRFGGAIRVMSIEPQTPHAGIVTLDMENGTMRVRLAVAEQSPHGVIELAPSR